MFTYPKFEGEIVRNVDANRLGWPLPGEASDDSGLGCNRGYMDLRRLSWAEAKRVFILEGDLIGRIESAADPSVEYEAIEEELSESDQHLYDLDLGVASAVVALSAARCVPFSSCSAGVFGGIHHETYPLIVFYAPNQAADLLLSAAEEANVGLESNDFLIAYADDIRNIRKFARSLISRSSRFNAIRIRRPRTSEVGKKSDQYELGFE